MKKTNLFFIVVACLILCMTPALATAIPRQEIEVQGPEDDSGPYPGKDEVAPPGAGDVEGVGGESAGNNTPLTATPLIAGPAALGATSKRVVGNIYPTGDVDYYSISLNNLDRVYAAVVTSISVRNPFSSDSTLSLIAPNGTTVLELDTDDGTFGGLSSSIAGRQVLAGAGTYYLLVQGNVVNTNQLRPYHLYVTVQGGGATNLPLTEAEPNEQSTLASEGDQIPANGWVRGNHGCSPTCPGNTADADFYKHELNAGDTVFYSLDPDPTRSNGTWNPRLRLCCHSNFIFSTNDANTISTPGPPPQANSEFWIWTVKYDGRYYVDVDGLNIGTPSTLNTDYRMSVAVFPQDTDNCTTYSKSDVIPSGQSGICNFSGGACSSDADCFGTSLSLCDNSIDGSYPSCDPTSGPKCVGGPDNGLACPPSACPSGTCGSGSSIDCDVYNFSFPAPVGEYAVGDSECVPDSCDLLFPGGTTTLSTITVPGNPRIRDLNLSLHTVWGVGIAGANLGVRLISPAGNDNPVLTGIGHNAGNGNGFNEINFFYDDEAAIASPTIGLPGSGGMTASTPAFVGSLNGVEGKFSDYDGEDGGGTWTLALDNSNTNAGELNEFSITICEAPPTCATGDVEVPLYGSDFESGDGGFTHSGTNDQWARGTPSGSEITTCNSGSNCWKTNLTGDYADSSSQDLFSPSISLPLGTPLRLSWAQKYQMENASFDHLTVDVENLSLVTSRRVEEFTDGTMQYVTQPFGGGAGVCKQDSARSCTVDADCTGYVYLCSTAPNQHCTVDADCAANAPPGTCIINPAPTTGPCLPRHESTAGWATKTVDVSAEGGSNIDVKFHIDSDISNGLSGLAVDDVKVTCCCPDDNDLCTDEVCDPQLGCLHVEINCDDNDCCTNDSCDPQIGCVNTPNTTPPVFTTQPSLDCAVLWPPQHGYVDFTAAQTGAAASSTCGPVTLQFASCASSQPENQNSVGDGNSIRDCVYSGDDLSLRAERNGACSPLSRSYTMTMQAVDACGNVGTSNSFEVAVWHDRGHSNDGPYISANPGSNQTDTRSGTNGTYGADCGGGSNCGTGLQAPDLSDFNPEEEIRGGSALHVNDVTLAKNAGGHIGLTWNQPVPSGQTITKFHIWRQSPGDPAWTLVIEVNGTTTTTVDSGVLNNSINYRYEVTAFVE